MADREPEPADEIPPVQPPWRRILELILRPPTVVLVALYFLIDDVVLAAVRPIVARLAALKLFARMAAYIHALPPYPTLLLFAVPFAILEPPKLIAVYMMGTGSFRSGLALLVVAHLASIVIVERLFHVTRDKLLTIGWFARLYGWGLALRDWAFTLIAATAAWKLVSAWAATIRQALRRVKAAIGPPLARLVAEAWALVRRLFLFLRRVAGRP